ncbi:involucrin isoform X2 [Hypomesus transpacificus]|uniref:involucrin isoform X2 n=1 Tax=Hypomesus transpacificus TaxID=137520 RepID=UPI001F07B89E|nr:involucrin isoform X2 [Hypomesus transpacificus]
MKTLLFLWCTVTVVLGLAPNKVVQRDLLPAQGHVVQEDSQPLMVKRTELRQIKQDTNPESVPLVQEKEAEVPLVQEKEAVVPLVQEVEAVVPLVQEEEAEVPLVQEEEAVVPLVQEEEAEVPLVQEEEKEAVPVMDPGLDMEPAAEPQPEEEVDPEMGVKWGLERSEVEEGPILEEESLGVEEPMMELEPLEDESLVGQDLTSDELQQSVFQYELEQEPIMELEPLPEEGLGMERKPYVMDEEPIMELEPLPEEGLGMNSKLHVIMGEEPIMELEPFGRHPVMEYNDIMVEKPRMELEPEIHRVPYSGTGRLSVMVEEPVMELEPLAGEESDLSPMKRGTPGVGGPLLFEQPIMGEGPMMDGAAHVRLEAVRDRRALGEEGQANRHQTGRFIWLDGAHWAYDDFLPGEPNNTADVENCIELLAIGNGKFNDMPCWDLRSFICSHPI